MQPGADECGAGIDPAERRQPKTSVDRRNTNASPGPLEPDPRAARSQGEDPDGQSRLGQHRVGILPPAMADLKLARRSARRRGPDRRRAQARGQAGPGREGTLPERDETPRGARAPRQAPRPRPSKLIQTAPNYDPKVRADYEVASRAAKDYLAGHNAAAIPLGNSLCRRADRRHQPGVERGDPEPRQDPGSEGRHALLIFTRTTSRSAR